MVFPGSVWTKSPRGVQREHFGFDTLEYIVCHILDLSFLESTYFSMLAAPSRVAFPDVAFSVDPWQCVHLSVRLLASPVRKPW